jgi:cytochrome c oxidase cbb3-type subunit 4
MMKFAKHSMENIAGVEVFPLISLGIFFTFFLLLGFYVWRTDKRFFSNMSELPLENDQNLDR